MLIDASLAAVWIRSDGYPWLAFRSDPPIPYAAELAFDGSPPAFFEFTDDEVDERILAPGR